MAVRGAIAIEADRCKGCGLCISACPTHCLRLANETFNARGYPPVEMIEGGVCTGCCVCAVMCPDVVFTVYRAARAKRGAAATA